MISEELNHWSKIYATEAIEKYGNKQVVCTGWSPSGTYHYGNSREAVTCNAIHRQLLNLGAESKFVFVVDDFDPLRKVPNDLKKYKGQLKEYLGFPLNRVPDFTGSFDSYAEFFYSDAKKAMRDWDFDVEFVNASDLYAQGKYNSFLEKYYSKETEVQALLERISGSPLSSLVSLVCQNCGNARTPKITKITDKMEFHYRCETNKPFEGCSHEGVISPKENQWKFKWRLDWPARQSFLGVTVEPSGKDHSAAGGSVDSALAIHEEIFNHTPPMLLRYGFITMKGKKFSGSIGGGLPASKVTEIMPYSAYLFLIYRADLLKDISFDPSSEEYGTLLDEYDVARRMYNGEVFEGREREVQKLVVAADLAMSDDDRKSTPSNARFSELALIYQTSLNSTKSTIEKLEKMGKIPDKSTYKELERRLVTLDTWLSEFAQDRLKFTILQDNPENIETHWSINVKNVWLNSLNSISENTTPDDFMTNIRDFGKDKNLGPKEFFPPFYQMLTGNSRGPNAANLVFALGKDYLIKRINSIKS